MRVKMILEEDFVNYKEPSLFIGTISCTGKCCIEANLPLSVCQNSGLNECAYIDIPDEQIVTRYKNNNITSAIVFGGLEPFDQFDELFKLINAFRDNEVNDPIIIYTGYNKDEILDKVNTLKKSGLIIIKFGRYIPDCYKKFDEVLGVTLASDNQYAEKI